MAHIALIKIAALTTAAALPFTVMSLQSAAAQPTVEGFNLRAAAPEQVALVEWARERFALAGLDAPSIEIYFHDSVEVCSMRLGVYRHAKRRLDMCIGDDTGVVARKTMLHEIAHGWIGDHLNDTERQEFIGIRDVDNWNSHDAPWERRGTEHAAEIMAWGLMDQRLWLTRFDPNSSEELAAAYQLLTGRPPVLRIGDEEQMTVEDKYRS